MVLLIGQYSTGKTTFIRYMLERDFPGSHIGPEPTTDRFMAVMHGKDERTIPGNALAADASRPFTALTKFGMAFLNKMEASQCQSPILEKLTFIDTPGVLSGEKQRIGRSYNFPEVRPSWLLAHSHCTAAVALLVDGCVCLLPTSVRPSFRFCTGTPVGAHSVLALVCAPCCVLACVPLQLGD
jgi:hypothetical protein